MGKHTKKRIRRSWNLTDLASVDQALGLLAEIEAGADRRQAELEARVANLRAEAAVEIGRSAELARGLRKTIEAWADENPEAFGSARSLALTHGRIGWRWTPPAIKLLKKAESVIAALKSHGLADAVIVRESVNKDVLATYPDERLKEIGAKRTQREEFFVDLADEANAGRAAATA